MNSAEFLKNLRMECKPIPLQLCVLVNFLFLIVLCSVENLSFLTPVTSILFFAGALGSRSISLSLRDEVRDRTIQIVQMTSLSTKEVALGKWFGASSVYWGCSIVLFGFHFYQMSALYSVGTAIHSCVYLLGLILLCQAYTLVLGVGESATDGREPGGVWILASFIVLGTGGTLYPMVIGASPLGVGSIEFWGIPMTLATFFTASVFVFLGWGVVGAVRSFRPILCYTSWPFVYLGFLLFCVFYIAGSLPQAIGHYWVAVCVIGVGVFLLGGIFAVLKYQVTLAKAIRLVGALRAGQPSKALDTLPVDAICMAGALICSLGLLVNGVIHSSESLFGNAFEAVPSSVLALTLYVIRDWLVVYNFRFRVNPLGLKHPFVAYFLFVYLIFPLVFGLIRLTSVIPLFTPFSTNQPGWLVPSLESLVALVFLVKVVWRALPEVSKDKGVSLG